MTAYKRAAAATAAATALLIAGCGSSSGNGATSTTPGAIDVTVHSLDPKYSYDQKEYPAKAGTVTIELVNDGKENHNLLIQGVSKNKFKLSVIGTNATKSGSVQLSAGTYAIYCDIAGHRGAGMEAKLIVS